MSIIRLSGLDAVHIAQQVFRPAKAATVQQGKQQQQQQGRMPATAGGAAWEPESHRVYYGQAVDAAGTMLDEVRNSAEVLTLLALAWGAALDGNVAVCPTACPASTQPACTPSHHTSNLPSQVLLLAMLEPRSYTAEDVIELHTHGGGLSAQRVLQRCLEAGARLAQPGEFTLRAFLNGRLDLSQAESVAQVRPRSLGRVWGWLGSSPCRPFFEWPAGPESGRVGCSGGAGAGLLGSLSLNCSWLERTWLTPSMSNRQAFSQVLTILLRGSK